MDQEKASAILTSIERKMSAVLERNHGKIPAAARNGKYDNRADESIRWDDDNGIAWWTNGFWGGLMNQMHVLSGKGYYIEECMGSEELMDRCFSSPSFMGLHHDTGFMWLPSSVFRFVLTGDREARRRGLEAATLLSGRFNPEGFIRAWNADGDNLRNGWVIIDSMMNISILFWASKETGDPRFRKIAERHADSVMKAFIRENRSVRHIVEFNAETGAFEREYGGQGYAEGTRWTRGQGWGIHGFTNTYLHTGESRYLEAAKRIADSFIISIPENALIPVDFDQPETPWYEDSTAAAIASSGLLTLAEASGKNEYAEAASRMLDALSSKRADLSPETDGILQKCTGSYHGTNDREINFTYADFYFIEALMTITGQYIRIW